MISYIMTFNLSFYLAFRCAPVSIYKDLVFEQFVPSGGRFDYSGATCLDATDIIKNSAGTTLYTNVIPSGDTNNQTILDSTVENSDSSFTDTVLAEGTIVLSDTTYEVYVDGNLESSTTLPSLVNQTINITWT